jgi:hypothetical protein
MGCTGSKPHMLLSSTITSHHHHHLLHHNAHPHHANSPQKGFILFNEKTFEYLKENESSIKQKLVRRVEVKLAATEGKATISGSSSISKALFSNAKRTLLPNLVAASSSNPEANLHSSNDNKVKAAEATSTTTTPNNNLTTGEAVASSSASSSTGGSSLKFKDIAVDSAVDYVLKYAINDFDIDNFKSSNQLSLKQIRKDIMKKTNNRESLSKINAVLQNSATYATLSNQLSDHATNTTTTTTTPLLMKSTGGDMAFYKSALHAAIDEFGSFIQENFIVINEYEKRDSIAATGPKGDEAASSKKSSLKSGLSAEEEESLKLKEAIELARQNFYKGKMSMVCLTKAGGYVVKEIKEPTVDSLASALLSTNNDASQLVSTSATIDSLASTANTTAVDVASMASPQQTNKSSSSEPNNSKSSINVSFFFFRIFATKTSRSNIKIFVNELVCFKTIEDCSILGNLCRLT